MLDAYQDKLIALAQASTVPEVDWFELVNLLKVAKVAIRPGDGRGVRPGCGARDAED